MNAATLPGLIQRFFTDRLCVQMEASRHTVAGYRDTFRLLLRYASARHGKPPFRLKVEDIDAHLVADFLVHTETARGNSARTRKTRLAAIRSFFRFVATTDPTWLLHCQRVLAMPNKLYVKLTVTFLDADEMAALLAAPERTTWQDGVIMCCSCLRSRPALGPLNWSASHRVMWCWGPARTSAA